MWVRPGSCKTIANKIYNPMDDEDIDEETKELMEDHDLEQDEAERVQEIMDETGLDADDSLMLHEAGF